MTSTEMRSLDVGSWFGPEFVGERVPLLRDILELVKGRVALDVEVKLPEVADRQAVVESLHTTLEPYVGQVELVISSFDQEFVRRARPRFKPIPVCRIYGPPDVPGREFGADQPYAILHHSHATEESVPRLHALGAKVLLWTVDGAPLIQRMVALGVDGICANDPAEVLRIVGPR